MPVRRWIFPEMQHCHLRHLRHLRRLHPGKWISMMSITHDDLSCSLVISRLCSIRTLKATPAFQIYDKEKLGTSQVKIVKQPGEVSSLCRSCEARNAWGWSSRRGHLRTGVLEQRKWTAQRNRRLRKKERVSDGFRETLQRGKSASHRLHHGTSAAGSEIRKRRVHDTLPVKYCL